MKHLLSFIFALLLLSCNADKQIEKNQIKKFKTVLGKTETKQLDDIVRDFDSFLNKKYKNTNSETKLKQYLQELANWDNPEIWKIDELKLKEYYTSNLFAKYDSIYPDSVWCVVLKYVYTKKVDMYKNDGVTRRYSESFKLKILAELSTGKYSKRQLSRIYGIQSSTINEWVRKYDRKDLMNTRIMVQTKDEISRLKELQKEIEQLKKLLIKKDLDKLVQDSYLEVAAENLGYKSVEELKKKLKHQALMKATSTTKQTGIVSMSQVCACFHLKRDAFYKYIKRWERYKSVESQVIQLVKEERKEQPRVGVRKLHETLQPSFEAKQIKLGRDSLFNILRANNMLVKRK